MIPCDDCETECAVIVKTIQILGQEPIVHTHLCLCCFCELET